MTTQHFQCCTIDLSDTSPKTVSQVYIIKTIQRKSKPFLKKVFKNFVPDAWDAAVSAFYPVGAGIARPIKCSRKITGDHWSIRFGCPKKFSGVRFPRSFRPRHHKFLPPSFHAVEIYAQRYGFVVTLITHREARRPARQCPDSISARGTMWRDALRKSESFFSQSGEQFIIATWIIVPYSLTTPQSATLPAPLTRGASMLPYIPIQSKHHFHFGGCIFTPGGRPLVAPTD